MQVHWFFRERQMCRHRGVRPAPHDPAQVDQHAYFKRGVGVSLGRYRVSPGICSHCRKTSPMQCTRVSEQLPSAKTGQSAKLLRGQRGLRGGLSGGWGWKGGEWRAPAPRGKLRALDPRAGVVADNGGGAGWAGREQLCRPLGSGRRPSRAMRDVSDVWQADSASSATLHCGFRGAPPSCSLSTASA